MFFSIPLVGDFFIGHEATSWYDIWTEDGEYMVRLGRINVIFTPRHLLQADEAKRRAEREGI